MAKKEKGYLAGLSDEMVAAAKQYLFDMDTPASLEMQRGEDFHKVIAKAHPATQPTLRAVAAKWLEDHMPIGAKTVKRPFDESNPNPWWEYSAGAGVYDPAGEKKDVSAQGRWLAEQAGLGRQDVINESRPIYRGEPIPVEKQLPSVNYLQEDRSYAAPAPPIKGGESPAEHEAAQAGMAEVET